MAGVLYSNTDGPNLLKEFEQILENDPLIDEVGFIHPSQFAMLIEENVDSLKSAGGSELLDDGVSGHRNMNFWCKDHKLGISTQVLSPLYKAAKCAFFEAARQYKLLHKLPDDPVGEGAECDNSSSFSALESKVMKHSKALLIISCDFGTAWSSRKLVLSKKDNVEQFVDELMLSALILSYSPKSASAWTHRWWVIKMIAARCSTLTEIVEKESELVEKIAEKSKMNYRAWKHRCWLVSYMPREQVLRELENLRTWAGLHVADSSCFHYRRRLLSKILDASGLEQNGGPSVYNDKDFQLWKDELEWDEKLIKRYVGREALWLHRRFLALCWIRHFAGSLTGTADHDINIFLDNERLLVKSCTDIPDNLFEDFQAQATHSITYILWLSKQLPDFHKNELREKSKSENLKDLLGTVCPEKSFILDLLD